MTALTLACFEGLLNRVPRRSRMLRARVLQLLALQGRMHPLTPVLPEVFCCLRCCDRRLNSFGFFARLGPITI